MELAKFFIAMNPPTVTDQEHRVGKRKDGSSYIYKDAKLTDARAKLRAGLARHVPEYPACESWVLRLEVIWCFKSKGYKSGSFKATKPDTDNLNKMLKDVMTELGFWHDDAQVAWEEIQKRWVDGEKDLPGIYIKLTRI